MVRGRLRDWLTTKVAPRDVELALWAVAGYHPKFGRGVSTQPADGAGPQLIILWSHHQFPACLEVIRSEFDLGTPPTFTDEQFISLAASPSAFDLIGGWLDEATTAWEMVSTEDKALIAALKHTLVGADVAGSALPSKTQGPARRRWIAESFGRKPTAENTLAVAT